MTAHETQDDLLSYALQDVSAEAASRIRKHLRECVECRRELAITSEALGTLGVGEAVEVPSHLRKEILSKIRPHLAGPARRGWPSGWLWVPGFAALALAAISLWLWLQNYRLRQELNDIGARLRSPTYQASAIREALTAPDAQQFALLPVNAAPIPQGKAIYRANQGSLIFIGSHFANIPAGKAYELWLLPQSGAAPVPAGVFKPDAEGNVSVFIPQFTTSVSAKGFAITMEPEAGSSTPTMPILLLGTASPA
jgi:hypothetical protein